jgi:hypothetical protein
MNVTLNLNPEVEKGLMARADARGISLDDYLQELVAREAAVPATAEPCRSHKPVRQSFRPPFKFSLCWSQSRPGTI